MFAMILLGTMYSHSLRLKMTVWPLFLLSMRALNSHAGPLLDEYEVVEVDLPELPQPELNTDLADILLPFRQKREAERQYSLPPRDIRYRSNIEDRIKSLDFPLVCVGSSLKASQKSRTLPKQQKGTLPSGIGRGVSQ